MEKKQSYEDYLERILMLEETIGSVRSIDIANSMNFARSSVSIAVKKLENDGLITVDRKDFYIHLTAAGRAIGEKTLHKHKILSLFFVKLGVSPKTAEEDACKIEHDISDESFRAFEEFLKREESK